MLITRTLFSILMLFTTVLLHAANAGQGPSEKNAAAGKSKKNKAVSYTLHIDNAINKNTTVDSVLVIFDRYDLTGAGIVAKVFYPDAKNHIVIDDIPTGKYYAEIYVLGLYKKHFSSIIRAEKSSRKNKSKLRLDYKDVYMPGTAEIPGENTKLFAYAK